MFRSPSVFAPFRGLTAAESTRHGGVSAAPYHALNLGKSTGDDPECVAQNRRLFCAALGFQPDQMAWSKQVHGDQVRIVTAPGGAEGYDALITNRSDILLCVSVADCTPVLIFDRATGAMAAIHAGWRGTAARIVHKTLLRMAAEYGTRGQDCYAYTGTCIEQARFETGEEVARQFAPHLWYFDPGRNKYFIDLKGANHAQLLEFGIPPEQTQQSPWCTMRDNADYFSHRAEKGTTGRMLAVIGKKAIN